MILLQVLRAFFILAVVAVSWSLVEAGAVLPDRRVYLLLAAILLAAIIITVDVLQPRKSLKAMGGLFFGLIVGMLISYGLSLVFDYFQAVYMPNADSAVVGMVKVVLGIICCYLCVSFILQTKDDIRFVIPYVEFSRQMKGQTPLLLDTSVIIDGRIADIAECGFIDQKVVVPRFVLHELQAVADSSDRLKRGRGRRGLDILNRLQNSDQIDVEMLDEMASGPNSGEPVDTRLLNLAKELNGRVVTIDYNLNKVAKVRGVRVVNINDLAKSLRPVFLPGEAMHVKIIRAGEEQNQGVGYLEDGTMVVVDGGRNAIGETLEVSVTSVLQTSAGRMIFGKADGSPDRRRGEGATREPPRSAAR